MALLLLIVLVMYVSILIKKFTGDMAKIEYEDKGRAPVFRVSSLGIGRKFWRITRISWCIWGIVLLVDVYIVSPLLP